MRLPGKAEEKKTPRPDLGKAREPIQVEVQVLDGAILGKGIPHVLLRALLVQATDEEDPALDR